jgi:hypothetical protein
VIDAERALAGRGDAVAGRYADIGKAKRETIVDDGTAGPGIRCITEHDVLRCNIELTITENVDHRRTWRRCRTGPDEFTSADRRNVARCTIAVDRGRSEH